MLNLSQETELKYNETSRKYIHIINGSWAFLLPFIPRSFAILFSIIAFIFVFLLARPNSVFGNIFNQSFSLMARKEDYDAGFLIGPSIYVVMVIFSLVFIDYRLAGAIFAILAFGDGFATLIGRKYGKYRIFNNKTLEGTLAFFVSAFPTSVIIFYLIDEFNTSSGGLDLFLTIYLPESMFLLSVKTVILIFLIVILLLSLIELFFGDYINDNILIPITAIILFYTCFQIAVSVLL